MNTVRYQTTYTNPVWSGYMADPYVLQWQGEYFAYGTGPSVEGRCFPMLRSQDLCNWQSAGGALELPAELSPSLDYWAPAVVERDGVFYLYYSAAPRDQATEHRLRVATATHPAGPFHDIGLFALPEDGFAIDADPFRDPRDGKWYLFYAKDYLEGDRPGTGLAVVPLADDMRSAAGEIRSVLQASADWQIYERNRTHYGRSWEAWHTLEGSCVVEHEGLYYCLYSGGCWYTDRYAVAYAVAEHPLGPWREVGGEDTRVLQGQPGMLGPGHNSVVLGPDGVTQFVVYHAWDTERTARRMCIDPLLWLPEGPRCDGPSNDLRVVMQFPEQAAIVK